jgi:hypothetical protein
MPCVRRCPLRRLTKASRAPCFLAAWLIASRGPVLAQDPPAYRCPPTRVQEQRYLSKTRLIEQMPRPGIARQPRQGPQPLPPKQAGGPSRPPGYRQRLSRQGQSPRQAPVRFRG